jgi:hypothetical protein
LNPATFLKCMLYQARKMNGHVFVCYGYRFVSFSDFPLQFRNVRTVWYYLFCRNHNLIYTPFMLITGFVTRVSWQAALIELEGLTTPEHLSSSPIPCGFRVAQLLIFCVVFSPPLFVFWTLIVWVLVVDNDRQQYLANSSGVVMVVIVW